MIKFEIGKKYVVKSPVDDSVEFEIKVLNRTKKTITADCDFLGIKRLKINDYDLTQESVTCFNVNFKAKEVA